MSCCSSMGLRLCSLSNHMTRSSICYTYRFLTLLHRSRPVWVGLYLVLLVLPVVWAQSAPVSSTSSESEAAKAFRLGMSLVKAGRRDEAIAAFKNGLVTDPQSVVLLNVIGATYSLMGDFAQAESYLLKCLQTDPAFVPARKNLAISYFNSGKYDLAITEFERLINTPGDARSAALLFLGIIAEKQGNFSKSASLLGESGEVVHQYPQALLSFAHSLFELKQAQKGDAVLKRLDAMSGVAASEYFKAGLLYSKQRQYRQALAEFERADKVDTGLSGLAYQRAVVLDRLDRSEEALQVLKGLTSIRPDADSLNLLADLARKNNDLNLAIQSLRQAAVLEPGREVNYLDFSTICMDYENYPLALEAADIGLAHIPGSYRLQVQKGAILEKLGRFGEAEKIVQKASGLQEDNSVALLSLAIIQTHAGELQDAINTLSSAITKFPSNSQMHYYLGVALEQTLERDAKAAEAFGRAIRLNPSFADSYYHLAKLYLKKDPKLAEKNLLTCLRLDPHHLSAEYSLGRLYLQTGRRVEGRALIDAFERQQQAEKLKVQQKPSLQLAQR
jgi:tetratricopeptide (TPR) repeat protein